MDKEGSDISEQDSDLEQEFWFGEVVHDLELGERRVKTKIRRKHSIDLGEGYLRETTDTGNGTFVHRADAGWILVINRLRFNTTGAKEQASEKVSVSLDEYVARMAPQAA